MRNSTTARHKTGAIVSCLIGLTFTTSCAGAVSPSSTIRSNATPSSADVAPTPTSAATPSTTPTPVTTAEPTAVQSRTATPHETPPGPDETVIIKPTPSPTPPSTSPFGRHDSPPSGVEDPSSLTIIPAGKTCRIEFPPPKAASSVATDSSLALPGTARICLFGFDTDKPVALKITAPDGSTLTRKTARDDGDLAAFLTRVPGNPEGTYRIHAEQGDLASGTTIEVVRPDQPKGLAVPQVIHRGQTVRIWFGA